MRVLFRVQLLNKQSVFLIIIKLIKEKLTLNIFVFFVFDHMPVYGLGVEEVEGLDRE